MERLEAEERAMKKRHEIMTQLNVVFLQQVFVI